VHHTGEVGGGEPVGALADEARHLCRWQGGPVQERLRQGLALDPLEHEVVRPERDHPGDVPRLHGREVAGLPRQSLARHAVLPECLAEELDGHLLPVPPPGGVPHLTHAAHVDGGEEDVVADDVAGVVGRHRTAASTSRRTIGPALEPP